MYIEDVRLQTSVLLYSVSFGMLLGVIYDVFRIIRLLIGKRKNAVFFQDFLFLVLSAFFTFLFLLVVNNGRFRLFIFAAVVAGFFLYYFTIGLIVIRLSNIIIAALKLFFGSAATLISAPVKLIIKSFGCIWRKVMHFLKIR